MDQNTLRRRGTGLRALDRGRAFDGLTLITPIAGPGEACLIDLDGTERHRWNLPYPPGRHARLLPDGTLFYQGKAPQPEPLFPIWAVYHGGVFLQVAPDGTVLREARHPFHHHDAELLPNGNLLLLAVEPVPAGFASRIRGGIPGSEASGGVVWGDVVYEMTWEGETVWRWSAAEHLDPQETVLDSHYAREHWPMANTVNQLADGSVLVGFRSASTAVVIDRATGAVTWRLGPDVLAQQHHPHELDNGNILVFDNGSYREGTSVPYSRVLEVDRASRSIVWEYRDDPPQNFYSPYMSNAQRLPNGNTLIAEGSFGRVFEVTAEGEVVWEYVVPYFGSFGEGVGLESSGGAQNAVFRAYRYPRADIPWL
ncbi:aryl-sulfate sulfotransferase [Streptomyces sp. SP17BM10]|uniref:aryl-sulfate sulfotransferase n=1 Tax=Streptomyces sp. SP17BM10 TaxID=3002530 RepID=UPI002E75F51B|nr:aryl-sulfate sulfotransferase [Streptomyces sp. SP17BM10]MEE1782135.1 aryl-sulfate sulfotransferase [Streptomyces sp. SP17BM10]